MNNPIKMKFADIIMVILVFIILGIFLISLSYPNSQEVGENSRSRILAITPLGTDMEDTIALIKRNGVLLGIHHIDYEHGYAISGRPSWQFLHDEIVIGEKSIRGFFRQSSNKELVVSGIQILWGFDKDSKLIDVYVWIPTEDDL